LNSPGSPSYNLARIVSHWKWRTPLEESEASVKAILFTCNNRHHPTIELKARVGQRLKKHASNCRGLKSPDLVSDLLRQIVLTTSKLSIATPDGYATANQTPLVPGAKHSSHASSNCKNCSRCTPQNTGTLFEIQLSRV
jgi:hypothetical protein